MATRVEEQRAIVADKMQAFIQESAKYQGDNVPSAAEEEHVNALKAEFDAEKKELDRLSSWARTASQWQDQIAELTRSDAQRPGPSNPLRPQGDDVETARRNLKSIGSRFTENPEYREWLASQVGVDGVVPDSRKIGQSPALNFKGMGEVEMNAVLTGLSSTSGGALIQNMRVPDITELGRRPLTVRDMITVGQTGSDVVEYVRFTTETNNAAPVAEATATAGASGVKPESDMALEVVTTNVITIAHWIAATKRALSDAPQLRTLIDEFLEYGLDEELEDQIMNGTGGQGFTGILQTSGRQTQAWDTNILTTTRKAKTKVRTVGRRRPTAFVLNPADWETIDLLKDNEARYYAGGPFAAMTPTLWGLPVIESDAIPAGTGLVGDLKTAVLWDREQAAITVSDSHSDFFIRNMVAILAELRAAFGVLKPNALVEIDTAA